MFNLWTALFHETGHFFQTYLGHGRSDTPEGISAGEGTRILDVASEGGEALEVLCNGGLINFFDDGTSWANLEVSVICAWNIVSTHAERALGQVSVLLCQDAMQEDHAVIYYQISSGRPDDDDLLHAGDGG